MYFDEIATKWDTQRRIIRAKVLADSIFKKLDNPEKITALEIGCGTGLISFELSDKVHEIYCVDESKEMLNVINEKIVNTDIHNIFPFGIDFLNKNNYHKKFDLIYSSMVFHHITDIENELKKLHKFLKENGYLIIIDLDIVDEKFHIEEKDFNGHHGFEHIDLQKAIDKSGFHNISFQTVYKGEKSINNEIIPYSLFLCSARE